MTDHLLSIALLSPLVAAFVLLLVPARAGGVLRAVALASAVATAVTSAVATTPNRQPARRATS